MLVYDEMYLDCVVHNLAAFFDLAVNGEGLEPDGFGAEFAVSRVARAIEAAHPDFLAGKSPVELLMIQLGREVVNYEIPEDRSPAYWAGWILALAQWQLKVPFKRILDAVPFSGIMALYHPYHEADEMKSIDYIRSRLTQMVSPLARSGGI